MNLVFLSATQEVKSYNFSLLKGTRKDLAPFMKLWLGSWFLYSTSMSHFGFGGDVIQNNFFLGVTSRHRDSFLEPTVTSQLKSEVKCEVICFRGVRAEPTMLFV